MISRKVLALTTIACSSLLGCMPSPTIKNRSLEDKIIACGAGFSENMAGSLAATYNRTSPSGEISAGLKEDARTTVIETLPPDSRLKGYEDYIKCIQTDWIKRRHLHQHH